VGFPSKGTHCRARKGAHQLTEAPRRKRPPKSKMFPKNLKKGGGGKARTVSFFEKGSLRVGKNRGRKKYEKNKGGPPMNLAPDIKKRGHQQKKKKTSRKPEPHAKPGGHPRKIGAEYGGEVFRGESSASIDLLSYNGKRRLLENRKKGERQQELSHREGSESNKRHRNALLQNRGGPSDEKSEIGEELWKETVSQKPDQIRRKIILDRDVLEQRIHRQVQKTNGGREGKRFDKTTRTKSTFFLKRLAKGGQSEKADSSKLRGGAQRG